MPNWPETMNAFVVFDSWAILAWIRNEAAAPRVDQLLEQSEAGDLKLSMSWINASEAYYMLVRKHNRHVAEEYLRRLPSLPIRLVLPDVQAVMKRRGSNRPAVSLTPTPLPPSWPFVKMPPW